MMSSAKSTPELDTNAVLKQLGRRSIVFVGLMGAGKTVVGRKVAGMLGLPFIDSDHEIESVSRMSIPELFAGYGEDEFRALERRVIARLLRDGPKVLSTGGGAFMSESSRRAILRQGVSVWLKADLDTLMQRVAKRQDRPLLKTDDPRGTLERLIAERYPIYQEADLTVVSRDVPQDSVAADVIGALLDHLRKQQA